MHLSFRAFSIVPTKREYCKLQSNVLQCAICWKNWDNAHRREKSYSPKL